MTEDCQKRSALVEIPANLFLLSFWFFVWLNRKTEDPVVGVSALGTSL